MLISRAWVLVVKGREWNQEGYVSEAVWPQNLADRTGKNRRNGIAWPLPKARQTLLVSLGYGR